jgi:NTE family protein
MASPEDPIRVENLALLSRQEVFAGLDAPLRGCLADKASRVTIEAGTVLFLEGSASDAMFVLVSGALTASIDSADGTSVRIADLFAGETVGEMGVITGDPRAATVTALRDCELLRLTSEDLLSAMRVSPDLAIAFARLVSRRLARAGQRTGRGQPKCFAIVPSPGVADPAEVARALAQCFEEHGSTALVTGRDVAEPTAGAFHALESAHRHVLYLADAEPSAESSAWTRAALRQSDEIIVVADGSKRAERGDVPGRDEAQRPVRRRHLVLLHTGTATKGTAAERLAASGADLVHHVANREDQRRLVRILLRRAVGIAFAGGGARAFAHVGVMRALREAGIHPDVFVGTSMGAVVAAAHAEGWAHDEIMARMRAAFAASRPLGDLAWPWVALFRGERVRRLLHAAFGTRAIEDLPLPFACVTTNLTTGSACLHRRGPLVEALRASVSIPGVFRPVLIDGHVHVDGAVVDNLPSAALRGLDLGPVIALDIGQPVREDTATAIPGLIDVLWRSSTISGVATEETYRATADLYFRAQVGDYRLLDWKGFDRAVALGYREARDFLDQQGGALDPLRPEA